MRDENKAQGGYLPSPNWRTVGEQGPEIIHFADCPPIVERDVAGFRITPSGSTWKRTIKVNKKTHSIRFTDETEDSVTIVVEPIGE